MKTYIRSMTAAVLIYALLLGSLSSVQALSATTMRIILTLDQKVASVDGTTVKLDAPATVINGSTYVPARFLGETMGIPVVWNDKTGQVEMTAAKFTILFDFANQKVNINGIETPFAQVAAIVNGKLMVKLTWFADYMGAKYTWNEQYRQIDMIYVKRPENLVSEQGGNSRPVAKFTFAKSSYKIGEPVRYVDLSYDPDAEGLPKYDWSGNKDVFFQSGVYPITLKVTDSKGNVSQEYTRNLLIEPGVANTELEYKLKYAEPGTRIPTDWPMLYAHFLDRPQLPKEVVEDRTRPLIVSDSPESIKEKGILYREKVNGKARLYADHVNETDESVQFVIMARNTTGKPVTITTTNRGEVYPSAYAQLIGHEASVDFMLHEPRADKLTIPAGETNVYVQMPDFYPGQGVNAFYDLETSGEIEFSFVAMANVQTPAAESLLLMPPLPFAGNVRGTFPVSDITWKVDLQKLSKTAMLTIGDGKEDVYVKGYDAFRQAEVVNQGNYGVTYHVKADKPRKMAVLLLSRGGGFKGPFKLNGEFVMAPPSGVLSAFTEIQLLGRTTGTEETFDMEFTPPAGSAFPVDLIFYPLE